MDPDGYVVVNWAGEKDTEPGKHRPHELYKVESDAEDSHSDNSSESEDTSENETWETASEDGPNENENRPCVLITSIAPSASESEEPTSPVVDNVDMESLNNVTNVVNQVEQTDGSDSGINLVYKQRFQG